MRVLFIGNSHTYFNDMPVIFRSLAEEQGVSCEVTMIAHGGWYLSQHVLEPDVRFNILFGNYNYIVLQEYAHPFGPPNRMYEAMETLCGWIHKAGAVPVAYMTWEQQGNGQAQPVMTKAYEKAAAQNNMLLAPVGQLWWQKLHHTPSLALFGPDGQHASPEGSAFAAQVLLDTILQDDGKCHVTTLPLQPQVRESQTHPGKQQGSNILLTAPLFPFFQPSGDALSDLLSLDSSQRRDFFIASLPPSSLPLTGPFS